MNKPSNNLMNNNGDDSSRQLTNLRSSNLGTEFNQSIAHEEESSLDLSLLYRYISRHKIMILSVTVLTILLTYIANLMLLPTYESTATFQIKPHKNLAGYRENGLNSFQGNRQFFSAQIAVLNGKPLASRVIELLELDKNPEFTGELKQRGFGNGIEKISKAFKSAINNFQKNDLDKEIDPLARKGNEIIARFQKRLNIIRGEDNNTSQVGITFASFNAETSALVANTVFNAYIQLEKDEKKGFKDAALTRLNNKLTQIQTKLKTSEERLNEYARESGSNDLDLGNEESLAAKRLAILNEEYLRAQSLRIELSSQFKSNSNASKNAILASILESPVLNKLKQNKAVLLAEKRRLESIYQPGYPKLQQIVLEISGIDEQISTLSQEHILALETQYKAAVDRESLLDKELIKQSNAVLDLNDKAIDFNYLKRELQTNQKLYEGLLERVKQAGIQSDLELSRISIIDKATTPLASVAPLIFKNTLSAGVAGFVLALTLAGIMGLLDRRIRTPEDLALAIPNYPNLSVTPIHEGDLPENTKIELLAATDPKGGIAEAFRSLRTSLMYALPGGFPESMMITSSMPGEAKTTTIINIALTMCHQNINKKVVLIDMDLRRPRIHKVFDIESSPGVTDFIVNPDSELTFYRTLNNIKGATASGEQSSAGNKYLTNNDSGLYILPAGSHTQNPVELLDSPEFDVLMAVLKSKFDIILLDAPPVMGLSDSVILSTKVGAVLLAVSAEVSTIDSVKSTIHRLSEVDAKLVGTVMTKFNVKSEGYYSSKYYQYKYYNYEYS